MTRSVVDVVVAHDDLADLDPARRRLALRALLPTIRSEEWSPDVADLADEIDGYGPLTALMRDDDVTDILVNGPYEVWVERAGRLSRTGVLFADEEALRGFVDRCLGRAGRRVDATQPVGDAALPDGSRIHVVLPPLASAGALVSIRRIPTVRYSLDDLVGLSMMTGNEAALLASAVASRKTIAVSGGTGSGKTTLVNALLSLVSGGERVIVIEETPELAPGCPHFVRLTARRANIAGAGGIDCTELVRAALRMRPDRIVIGEVRGPEALAALAAMSTGHEGSMVTVHARSAGEVVERMVALALQSNTGSTESSLRRQFAAAFDLLVHVERTQDGRRVAAIESREDREG